MARPRNEDRKKRIPVGVPRQNLEFGQRKGYRRRVVIDEKDRIQRFLEGGYQFVMREDAERIGDGQDVAKQLDGIQSAVVKTVGVKADGTPQKAYLMEIREDWYEEDQAEKMRQIDEREKALKRGHEPVEKSYVPTSAPMNVEHIKG